MARTHFSDKLKTGFIIISSIWWNWWLILHWVALKDLGIEPLRAFADALISIGLLAVLSTQVIRNLNYYLPGKERYLYVLIVSAALSSIWLIAVKLSLKFIYKNYVGFPELFSKTVAIRYSFAFLIFGCMTMLGVLWYSKREQDEENQHQEDNDQLVREAELNKLRQQLQPHFLFNSLNSISALTGSQPENARHMIQQLADFLRSTIKKEAEQFTTLEEELKYLGLYLDIEKVRFGYRLQTHIDVEDDVLPLKIPTLLLQPLVENAIKFGLYDNTGKVVILIYGRKKNGMLEVKIENPFDEFTAMPLTGTGFGLSSVKRRLVLLFGRHDLFRVEKVGGQFLTTINIPQ